MTKNELLKALKDYPGDEEVRILIKIDLGEDENQEAYSAIEGTSTNINTRPFYLCTKRLKFHIELN